MIAMDEIVDVAAAAARKAGAIQKEYFGKRLNVDKLLKNDVKLEADRLCETAIIGTIRNAFPNHAIAAEESGKAEGEQYIWYVDPLDGTVNFYYGIPYFCTTLACYRKTAAMLDGLGLASLGDPLVGVTYAPLLDEMFIGIAGEGATLNNNKVEIREEDSLAESYVISAIGNAPEKVNFTADYMLPLARKVRKMRNLGACAYDLANTAAGRASGFFEFGVNAWDIAAGRVLVEAAGGRFSAQKTDSGQWFVAASGQNIHEALLAELGFQAGA